MVTSLRRRSDPKTDGAVRVAPSLRRRRIDVLGLAAVLAGVAIFVNLDARSGVDVLVAARSVPAGHVLEWADLTHTKVSVGRDLQVISTADEASIVGRATSVALPAGAPLVRADLDNDPLVPADQVKLAVPIKVSNLLPNLAAGDHVLVVDTGPGNALGPSSSVAASAAITIPAIVIGVQMPSSDLGENTATVSLQLPRSADAEVSAAAAAGRVWLSVVSPDAP